MDQDKKRLLLSFVPGFLFLGLLWAIKGIELQQNIRLFSYGVYPRTVNGLVGIIASPLVHSDVSHLFSNTFPLLLLLTGIIYFYGKIAKDVFLWVYLATGALVWVLGRESYHIGASGLVYGFASFLFFSGIFRGDRKSMAVSLLITIFYGGMIWGVLPLQNHVSWETHLIGGIMGMAAAIFYRNRFAPIDIDDEEEENFNAFNFSYSSVKNEGGTRQQISANYTISQQTAQWNTPVQGSNYVLVKPQPKPEKEENTEEKPQRKYVFRLKSKTPPSSET